MPENFEEKKYKFDILFKVTTTLIAMLAMTMALYFQFSKLKETKTIRKVEYVGDELQSRILEVSEKQKEIELALSSKVFQSPPATKDFHAVEIKLKDLEGKIAKINDEIMGLRQAINPLNPDEILTIARLKDSINNLSTNLQKLEVNIAKGQEEFRKSVLRELDASGKAMNLVLIVLIPLVLNLLYSIWKDRKEIKKVTSES